METDACINTPGRCNIGGTDGIVYYFGRDFLDRDVCSCNYTSVLSVIAMIMR